MPDGQESSLVMRFQRYNFKAELTEWAYDQFDEFNIRKPEEYTANELKYLNKVSALRKAFPEIPKDFIDNHVAKRNFKT